MRIPSGSLTSALVLRVAALAALILAGPAAARPGAAAATPRTFSGGTLPPGLAAKLDPRLWDELAAPAPIPVWLTFADKGEQAPADLAARLAAAEAALTPRARVRRLRTGVQPLVSYDDLPVEPRYLAELERQGLRVLAVSRWLNRAAVRVAPAQLADLAALPCVAGISPVERMRRSADGPGVLDAPPVAATRGRLRSDGALSTVDYGLTLSEIQQMNVPAVHDSGYIGTGVLVCILDDDFTWHEKHEALRNVIIAPGRQRDFVQGDTLVSDSTVAGIRHGTQVMGCIAGNLQGTYVGSGFGAQFALARTEVDASETPVEMLYWGMGAEWADSLGADVITSSLGYSTFDNPANDYTYADMNGRTTTVSRAAEIAASKGILLVNAVGNEGASPWHYLIAPADVGTDSMIAVGAVDQNGVVTSFTSWGPSAAGCIKPDLVARGLSNPLVAVSGAPNAYTAGSGTSFATPLVAGLAACLVQARPSWPPSTIARALRESASHSGNPDNHGGWGIPNGLAALQWLSSTLAVSPPQHRFSIRLLGPNPLSLAGDPLSIQFGLGESDGTPTRARVRVYDVAGRVVRDVYDGPMCCHETLAMSWDGRNGDGARVRPGLYLIALESGGQRRGARVIVLP